MMGQPIQQCRGQLDIAGRHDAHRPPARTDRPGARLQSPGGRPGKQVEGFLLNFEKGGLYFLSIGVPVHIHGAVSMISNTAGLKTEVAQLRETCAW